MNGLNLPDTTTLYLNNIMNTTGNKKFFDNYNHPLVSKINFSFMTDYLGLTTQQQRAFCSQIGPVPSFTELKGTLHPFAIYDTMMFFYKANNKMFDGFPIFINCKTATEMLKEFEGADPPYLEDYAINIPIGSVNLNGATNTNPWQFYLFDGGGAFYPVPIQINAVNYETVPGTPGTVIAQPYNVLATEINRTIGCKEFTMIYESGTKNRFSFSNLHTPLKVSSHSEAGIPNQGIEGQQVIKSTIFRFDYANNENGTYNPQGFIPKHSSGGIMILSFVDDLLVSNIKNFENIYNALFDPQTNQIYPSNQLQESLLSYFSQNNTQDIIDFQNANNINWEDIYNKNSIWARLGFSYNQIFNIRDNLTQFPLYGSGDTIKTLGRVTFNEENLSSQEGLAGLGASAISQNVPIQFFDSSGPLYNVIQYIFSSPFDNFQAIDTGINATFKNSFLTCGSRYIAADNLPDLMANNNYYIIESDIVKNNFIDIKGNYNSVIGIVSLENSNQDTLFSTVGIDFTVLEQKILSTINIRITNPDGSNILNNILNENSAFIFIIQKDKTQYLEFLQNEQNKQNNKILKIKKKK
jgi:hypothetical protein